MLRKEDNMSKFKSQKKKFQEYITSKKYNWFI